MKKIGLILMLILVLYLPSFGQSSPSTLGPSSLSTLITRFRAVTGEPDTTTSLYSDATAKIWLNLAQYNAASIGRMIEDDTLLPVSADSMGFNSYIMPARFRELKAVFVKNQGKWQVAIPKLPFDTSVFQYYVRQTEPTTFYVDLFDGWKEKKYDLIYDGSIVYSLPADVREILSAMVFNANEWRWCLPNPYFNRDTVGPQFFVSKNDPGYLSIYLKGTILEDDTVRVFYKGPLLETNDSVRFCYYAAAVSMDSSAALSSLPADKENLILNEALTYYQLAKGLTNNYFTIWQQVRSDMGYMKGVKEAAPK